MFYGNKYYLQSTTCIIVVAATDYVTNVRNKYEILILRCNHAIETISHHYGCKKVMQLMRSK
jgi:hypothetical protein